MLWGCMLWPRYACRIDGRMDGEHCIQILDDELQESLTLYSKSPQDNILLERQRCYSCNTKSTPVLLQLR